LSLQYFFPLNKRARLLLKLDSLFQELDHLKQTADYITARQAIERMFEILQLIERVEIKMELAREAEKFLVKNTSHFPELQKAIQELSAQTGKLGEELRTQPSLISIQKRLFQTSGACVFDAPSLHAWLSCEPGQRYKDLNHMYAHIGLLDHAVKELMKAYFQSFTFREEFSENGLFHLHPSSHSSIICIEIKNCLPLLIPEVSLSPKAVFLKIWAQESLLSKNIPYNGPVTLRLSEY